MQLVVEPVTAKFAQGLPQSGLCTIMIADRKPPSDVPRKSRVEKAIQPRDTKSDGNPCGSAVRAFDF